MNLFIKKQKTLSFLLNPAIPAPPRGIIQDYLTTDECPLRLINSDKKTDKFSLIPADFTRFSL